MGWVRHIRLLIFIFIYVFQLEFKLGICKFLNFLVCLYKISPKILELIFLFFVFIFSFSLYNRRQFSYLLKETLIPFMYLYVIIKKEMTWLFWVVHIKRKPNLENSGPTFLNISTYLIPFYRWVRFWTDTLAINSVIIFLITSINGEFVCFKYVNAISRLLYKNKILIGLMILNILLGTFRILHSDGASRFGCLGGGGGEPGAQGEAAGGGSHLSSLSATLSHLKLFATPCPSVSSTPPST